MQFTSDIDTASRLLTTKKRGGNVSRRTSDVKPLWCFLEIRLLRNSIIIITRVSFNKATILVIIINKYFDYKIINIMLKKLLLKVTRTYSLDKRYLSDTDPILRYVHPYAYIIYMK